MRAKATNEGCSACVHPGVRFYRVSAPATFRKSRVFGPTLIVVAQGSKLARFGPHALTYDPSKYLVLTGEALFDGTVLRADAATPYLAFSVEIPPDVIAKMLVTLGGDEPISEQEAIPAFVANLDRVMEETLVRLLLSLDDDLERTVVTPLVIEELVFRLLRSDAARVLRGTVGRDRNASAVEKAMQFIRDNASVPLSVDAVAKHVAMSPSHFAHRFRAVARVSPMRYLKHVRLNNARLLLLAMDETVAEVARRVGYECASHFARDFKAYFGTAPAEYARILREDPAGGPESDRGQQDLARQAQFPP